VVKERMQAKGDVHGSPDGLGGPQGPAEQGAVLLSREQGYRSSSSSFSGRKSPHSRIACTPSCSRDCRPSIVLGYSVGCQEAANPPS
jgi:hypothetical protein